MEIEEKVLKPEMDSMGVSETRENQFYKQTKFLENILGIEENLKLGQIVQEVSTGKEKEQIIVDFIDIKPSNEIYVKDDVRKEEYDPMVPDNKLIKSTKHGRIPRSSAEEDNLIEHSLKEEDEAYVEKKGSSEIRFCTSQINCRKGAKMFSSKDFMPKFIWNTCFAMESTV